MASAFAQLCPRISLVFALWCCSQAWRQARRIDNKATVAIAEISGDDYASLIGPGFATNWFKIENEQFAERYETAMLSDIVEAGFTNLRLRSRADLHPTGTAAFETFLDDLEVVVDDCLSKGIVPIVSWIHHDCEEDATEECQDEYVQWWTQVAGRLSQKSFHLAFNLFTEIGGDGENSLRMNTTKYNVWTRRVVAAIRTSGGVNGERVLILGSPGKKATDLYNIDPDIYEGDKYMMVEWHLYASGPNHKEGGQKEWRDDGDIVGKDSAKAAIQDAVDFQKSSGLKSYLGAWMPWDNGSASLSQYEAEKFAKFWIKKLLSKGIGWSMNVFDSFYDVRSKPPGWFGQGVAGPNGNDHIDMSNLLAAVREAMA